MRERFYILTICAGIALFFSSQTKMVQAQAIVTRTNCPRFTTPGTIVAVQQVQTQANYPIIVLACYTLDPVSFVLDDTTSPPTIRGTGQGGTIIYTGTGGSGFDILNEIPTGSVNGINTNFTLSQVPKSLALGAANAYNVYVNGLKYTPGVDYQIVAGSKVINFFLAPAEGSVINADYSVFVVPE